MLRACRPCVAPIFSIHMLIYTRRVVLVSRTYTCITSDWLSFWFMP
jgi:hypothetical protein